VLKWSRARKRYERQGLLVEEKALETAEAECLADKDAREAARVRAAEWRKEVDAQYVNSFALRVREIFPHSPPGRETVIATHACRKYSGRVGRSLSANALDESAIRLAVAAHVRHGETQYDELLMEGRDRFDARASVQSKVEEILEKWESGLTPA